MEEIFLKPLSVRAVRIVGAHRTQNFVIEEELADAYEAETAGTLLEGVTTAVAGLRNLGIFEKVNIKLDPTPDNDPELTDLVVEVTEKSPLSASIGANKSESESTGTAKIVVKNLLGSAERVELESTVGTNSSSRFSGKLVRPRFLGFPMQFQAQASQLRESKHTVCSLDEKQKNIGIVGVSESGEHRCGLTLSWRDLVPLRDEGTPYATLASRPVLFDCMSPSIKGSLAYTFTHDSRDHPTAPTTGSFFTATLQNAGLVGGDVYFNSVEATAQRYWPVGPPTMFGLPGPTLSLGMRLGFIAPYGQDSRRAKSQGITGVRINDRFQAGGPLTLRGFRISGIGPRAVPKEGNSSCPGGDSLGSEALLIGCAKLEVPVPLPLFSVSPVCLPLPAFCPAKL